MPAKPKFTRIPKVRDLIEAGVPAEAIPTYCALTDYANNKTGLCWPKMETWPNPGPVGTDRTEAPTPAQGARPRRVRRAASAAGEVQLVRLQGAPYYAHHRTRGPCGIYIKGAN